MEHLPPGFRFYPTEEELVSFYLLNKLEGKRQDRLRRVIPEIDICSTEPWDLPKVAGELCQGDTEQWFFFTPRQEREARGGRPSRTTASGYWKATGSPGYVYSSDNRVIGVKKTMLRHEFSLCRVYIISGSFRAFDRRPLEAGATERQLLGDKAMMSAQHPRMVDNTSSSETSNSGGDLTDLPQTAGSADWDMVDNLAKPLWEWEQLNWP